MSALMATGTTNQSNFSYDPPEVTVLNTTKKILKTVIG